MILCTKACDTTVKNGLPREERKFLAIKRLSEICQLITVDPSVDGNTVEAFVVSSDDVKVPRMAAVFEQALAHKHEDARVIFINKTKKPTKYDSNFDGIDIALTMPKPQQMSDAIYSFNAKLSEKPKVMSAGDIAGTLEPRSQGLSFDEIAQNSYNDGEDELSILLGGSDDVELPGLNEEALPPPPEAEEEPPKPSVGNPRLVERMKNVAEVADVTYLMKEMSAEAILRDIAKDNAQFGVLENKVKQLKEEIQGIMLSTGIPESEKLQKVRSIAYDKRYYNLQSNTLIEAYVTEIIDSMTTTVENVLSDKLQKIELSLSKAAQYGEGQMNFGRLAGINEERANIIMELYTLDAEIKELATHAADILTELSSKMSAEMNEVSGSSRIDTAIKINGPMIIDAQAFETILKVISLSTETTEFFQRCVRAVKDVIAKHNALVQVDKEQIAVQMEYIKYMHDNNIEDTVIMNTLLKQSLRVFTGPEGSGRSIVPYLLSESKSRQNANVLLVDLTGSCKWDRYGISYVTLDEYRQNRYQDQLVLVKGTCETPEEAQTLTSILTRAADYYRVINLVLNMEQTQVFDILCSDIRCINFITDTKFERMAAVREFVPRVTYNNVAKRIIVNDCSIPASEAINFFGLTDNYDTQILTIDHVKQLELASFRQLNPKNIDAVTAAIKDVGKYA